MLAPDKTKIYITKNLTDEQFEILLDYLIKEDGNWEADEIEIFRKDKYDIAFEGGFWVDNYKGSDFRYCATELFSRPTRFEYITNKGREVVEYGEFEFEIQDEGRTLKVFKT